MRSSPLLAVGLIVVPLCVTAANASTPASMPRAHADTVSRLSSPPDSLRLQSLLARADEASYAGRVGEARRLYRSVITAQKAGDQFAGDALWRLATTNLYADDVRGAAEALDELAASAARYGDPTWELRGTFEAAVLYAHLKRPDLVATRLERVRCLLKSPVISETEKSGIRERIREK